MTNEEKDVAAAEFRALLDREPTQNVWRPHEARTLLKSTANAAKRPGSGVTPDVLHAVRAFSEATSMLAYLEHELMMTAARMRASGIQGFPEQIEKSAGKLMTLLAKGPGN